MPIDCTKVPAENYEFVARCIREFSYVPLGFVPLKFGPLNHGRWLNNCIWAPKPRVTNIKGTNLKSLNVRFRPPIVKTMVGML